MKEEFDKLFLYLTIMVGAVCFLAGILVASIL